MSQLSPGSHGDSSSDGKSLPRHPLTGPVRCSGVLLALVILFASAVAPDARATELCEYEGATYLGNHPKEKRPGWHKDFQGMTHGEDTNDSNWYISQHTGNVLWRVPFSVNLAQDIQCGPITGSGVGCRAMADHSMLTDAGYNHFGDPDHYDPDPLGGDGGFVFVPLEGFDADAPGAVAVYATPSLDLVGFSVAQLDGARHMPWVSFDNRGYLYSSMGGSPSNSDFLDPRGVYRWEVDWARLRANAANGPGGNDNFDFLRLVGKVELGVELPGDFSHSVVCTRLQVPLAGCSADSREPILNAAGGGASPGDFVPLGLRTPQGADFSDDGRFLFILNGTFSDHCQYGLLERVDSVGVTAFLDGCGIHVFEVTNVDMPGQLCSAGPGDCRGRRVAKSHGSGSGLRYQYSPGFPFYGEPEGLDWFDLDAPGAPNIPGTTPASCLDPDTGATLDPCPVGGQLHAVLLDNNSGNNDEIFIKHYRVDLRCRDVPDRELSVAPESHDFEEVLVGSSRSVTVIVRNTGEARIVLEQFSLPPLTDTTFEFVGKGLPTVPETIVPGAAVFLTIRFAPQVEQRFSTVVRIKTSLSTVPLLVPLAGEGVGFAAQARSLIEGLDNGLDRQELSDDQPNQSSSAFRALLQQAEDTVEQGAIADACDQLADTLRRVDGLPVPADLVSGPAALQLVDEIALFRERLGCPFLCADGLRGDGEACDDRNLVSGDGCSADCSLNESGFACATPGFPCVSVCGDGLVVGLEDCDDGNTDDGDGCSASCETTENGFACLQPGLPCVEICGDGMIVGDESCDDGNTEDLDGCSGDCRVREAGFTCEAPGVACEPICADGTVVAGEACDDGNTTAGDGCAGDCSAVEEDFVCPPDGGACLSSLAPAPAISMLALALALFAIAAIAASSLRRRA